VDRYWETYGNAGASGFVTHAIDPAVPWRRIPVGFVYRINDTDPWNWMATTDFWGSWEKGTESDPDKGKSVVDLILRTGLKENK
jgi:hypothetical protein